MNFVILHIIQTTADLFQKSTPPPNNPWQGELTGITPPTGWIIAGLLILILIAMIYQEIKKLVKRLIRKK